MRAVVDTNVWVSAFLTPGGAPASLLLAMFASALVQVYSTAIEMEYRAVLARTRFDIDPLALAAFFGQLHGTGQQVDEAPELAFNLPHPDDAPFMALALYAGCPLVTGNAKHFPKALGVEVMTPREWLETRSG